MYEDISIRLAKLADQIATAARAVDRDPADIRLLPVSKTHPSSAVLAAVKCGYRAFGENRSQEAAAKALELADEKLYWVMIGHLQRNKVNQVCNWASELQSLDSLKLAAALDNRLTKLGKQLPVYVEVNVSGESAKTGITPDETVSFCRSLSDFPALLPQGLMTVAINDELGAATCFKQLASLRDQVQDATGQPWPELSMGMSGDFEAAIAHGATCIRIGTAIFGNRGTFGGGWPS